LAAATVVIERWNRTRLARTSNGSKQTSSTSPGCGRRTTQIHHLVHWVNGGPTRLANLVSLCDSPHWMVHEGGWSSPAARGATEREFEHERAST
jgi:hypothetical protein